MPNTDWKQEYDKRFCDCSEAGKDGLHSGSCELMQGCYIDHQEQKHFIETLLEAQRVEMANKVREIYKLKYRHVTRDYRKEDQFRDDVLQILTPVTEEE